MSKSFFFVAKRYMNNIQLKITYIPMNIKQITNVLFSRCPLHFEVFLGFSISQEIEPLLKKNRMFSSEKINYGQLFCVHIIHLNYVVYHVSHKLIISISCIVSFIKFFEDSRILPSVPSLLQYSRHAWCDKMPLTRTWFGLWIM